MSVELRRGELIWTTVVSCWSQCSHIWIMFINKFFQIASQQVVQSTYSIKLPSLVSVCVCDGDFDSLRIVKIIQKTLPLTTQTSFKMSTHMDCFSEPQVMVKLKRWAGNSSILQFLIERRGTWSLQQQMGLSVSRADLPKHCLLRLKDPFACLHVSSICQSDMWVEVGKSSLLFFHSLPVRQRLEENVLDIQG